ERSIIRQYLSHRQVKRRTDKEGGKWSVESYSGAIKVFVDLKQSVASEPASPLLTAKDNITTAEDDTAITGNLFPSDNSTTANNTQASDNPAKDTTLSYPNLLKRMKRFMSDFDVFKTEAYEARAAKRAARDAQSKSEEETMVVNPFATIDKPDAAINHQYRPRFSPKVRFEPSEEQPAPNILMQYEL
ncbi:hypothetical protein BGZ79_005905, partial [Entomortierella chlamydospora]